MAIEIVLQPGASRFGKQLSEILGQQLKLRTGLASRVSQVARAGAVAIVLHETALPAGEEAFEIRTGGSAEEPVITITGRQRGLLYGVGRVLRSIQRDGRRGVVWPRLNVAEAPATEVRGIYFPTQAYPGKRPIPFNAYSAWFMDEKRYKDFEQVLIELMLWGLNTIGLWYAEWMDAPWDATASGRKEGGIYRRLVDMAHSWGLKVCLLMTPNLAPDAFCHQHKAHLREKIPRGLWSQFSVPNMLCPSVPAIRKYLLDYRRRLIELFQPDWIELFPTDPGGCDCEKCHPWRDTYWKMAQEILGPWKGRVAMRSVNFWYFWNRDARNLGRRVAKSDVVNTVSTQAPWQEETVDRLRISDGLAGKGKKIIFWPDITMIGGWGTYGTYPHVKGLRELFRLSRHVHGVLPYTEGRYDDINKFAMLSLAWRPEQELKALARGVLEGMHNQAMPAAAVEMLLALEGRDFAKAQRLLAAVEQKLDRRTVGHWRWYSLSFYIRHAQINDLAAELTEEIKKAVEAAGKRPPTRAQIAGWRRGLAQLDRRLAAAHREMPKLYKLVNDFRRPRKTWCGTRLYSLADLARTSGLTQVRTLLAELTGQAAGPVAVADATAAMNLHQSGKRKRKT